MFGTEQSAVSVVKSLLQRKKEATSLGFDKYFWSMLETWLFQDRHCLDRLSLYQHIFTYTVDDDFPKGWSCNELYITKASLCRAWVILFKFFQGSGGWSRHQLQHGLVFGLPFCLLPAYFWTPFILCGPVFGFPLSSAGLLLDCKRFFPSKKFLHHNSAWFGLSCPHVTTYWTRTTAPGGRNRSPADCKHVFPSKKFLQQTSPLLNSDWELNVCF